MQSHEKPGYFWGQLAAAAIPAAVGYFGASKQAEATSKAAEATNATNQASVDYTKEVNEPIVRGGKEILNNYNFQPFQEAKLRGAQQAQVLGDQYSQFVQPGTQNTAYANSLYNQFADPNQTLARRLAGGAAYADSPEREAVLNRNIRDIDRSYATENKDRNAKRAKAKTFLSTATAKAKTLSDSRKSEDIQDHVANERYKALETGYDRAGQDLETSYNAAGQIANLGNNYFNLANQAPALNAQASDYGTQAPFDPYSQYAALTQGRSSLPTYQTAALPSPIGAGAGAALTGASTGLDLYNRFNGIPATK